MALATVTLVLALYAERQPYDRYQSIVDRQMFGQPPPGFDPTKPPSEVSAKDARAQEQELTKEQEQVKSAVHFSVINVTPSGDTAVGFTDNTDSKNPKHYYLKVGESRDGWTVKEADPLAASMTIAKGEIEVSLTIGGNSANGGTKKSGGAASASSHGNAVGGRPNLLGGRMGGRSLRERKSMRAQQRAEEQQAAEAEKARLAEERERERAQREAEKEAERAEREKEREETQKRLAEMAEELKRQREESAAKANEEKSGGEDADSQEGDGGS